MFPGDLGRRKAFEQERLKELLEAVLGASLQLTGPSVSTIRCVKLGFNRQIHDDSLHYAAELFSHREFCHDHLTPPVRRIVFSLVPSLNRYRHVWPYQELKLTRPLYSLS